MIPPVRVRVRVRVGRHKLRFRIVQVDFDL